MAYVNVFGGLSDALYGAGKRTIRRKYGLPEEDANTSITGLETRVDDIDDSINNLSRKIDRIIMMLSPTTERAPTQQMTDQMSLFPEAQQTQLELPLEQAKESLTEQIELPLTTELEDSKPDIVEKVMSIAEKSGEQIELDFTTPLEKAETNIVDTIKESNQELSDQVVTGVSEFIDKQEQEKLEAEERKSDIEQYSDVEGKGRTRLSKRDGGGDLGELMESQKKSFGEIFKMLDASNDSTSGLGSIGKIVGKLAGLVGLAAAVLGGGVMLGNFLIADWLREKLGIDEKFKEIVEGVKAFITDPWDFIFGGNSDEEKAATEEKEKQLNEAGVLQPMSQEEKEKYLDEAKESGLYDKDLIGDSEIDEAKLEAATPEQLQAILADKDTDARTRGKVIDALAAKKGVVLSAGGGVAAGAGGTGGTGGSSGPSSRGGRRDRRKRYARLEDIPTPPLSTVKSKSGASAQVNSAYVAPFQSLINYLDNSGYKIKSLGGYNKRFVAGQPGIPSIHSYGAALDVNPGENPMQENLVTDLPKGIGQVAKQLGIGWGGNWTSIKDPMHFSVDKNEGGTVDIRGSVPSMAIPDGKPAPVDADTMSAGTTERPEAEIESSAGQPPAPAAPAMSVASVPSVAKSTPSTAAPSAPAGMETPADTTTATATGSATATVAATPVAAEPVPTAAAMGNQLVEGTAAIETNRAEMAATPAVVNNVMPVGGGCKWQPTPPPPPRPLPAYEIESSTDKSIKSSFNRDRWAMI